MENPWKKRKKDRAGGIWQRQRAATQETMAESCLFVVLMTMFAKGNLSGAQCHTIAKAAKQDLDKARDGYHFPKLDDLAHLQHGKNLQQHVFRAMSKEANFPEPFEAHIPMKGVDPHKPSASIMLPHEVFAYFFSKEDTRVEKLLPTEELCQTFWSKFQHHPCMAGHPVLGRQGFRQKCVPLCLHGDEVPISGVGKIWCRKALMLSWCSLLAVAAGRNSQRCMVYMWGVFEHFLVSGAAGTMETFWSIIAWSFKAIWSGLWPQEDWRGIRSLGVFLAFFKEYTNVVATFFNSFQISKQMIAYLRFPPGTKEALRAGQQLAKGYFGCLVQFAGDLDYYAAWLQIPRWSNHAKPCSQCRSTFYGETSWLDNRTGSGWQSSFSLLAVLVQVSFMD